MALSTVDRFDMFVAKRTIELEFKGEAIVLRDTDGPGSTVLVRAKCAQCNEKIEAQFPSPPTIRELGREPGWCNWIAEMTNHHLIHVKEWNRDMLYSLVQRAFKQCYPDRHEVATTELVKRLARNPVDESREKVISLRNAVRNLLGAHHGALRQMPRDEEWDALQRAVDDLEDFEI